MSHHAGKAFAVVLGACVISQCVGPNCFLCENKGCKSRWLAENLSLAGALRLRLQWLMEMVNTVLPPGSHVGARRERNIECALPHMLWVEEQGTPNLLQRFCFFLSVVSVNNILCFFNAYSSALQYSLEDRINSNLHYKQATIYSNLLLTSHCKYSG